LNKRSIFNEGEVMMMQRFLQRSLRIVLGLVLMLGGLTLGGCAFFKKNANTIEATGNVEMTEVTVSSKVAGRVEQLRVDEGQKVKKGDLLLRLDHDDLETQITAAQANLTVANLRNQQLTCASKLAGQNRRSSHSLKAAQIELAVNNKNAAKASYEKAVKDLQRMTRLYQEQVVSKAEYDQAVTARDTTQAQYRACENQVTLAQNAAETDDIFLAGRQAEAQLKQAETNLVMLQIKLKNARIVAPVSGVVANKLTELGEVVSQGTPLLVILDNARPWVKVYLPLVAAEKVSLGQKVLIAIDAFPEQKFCGKIFFIAVEAEFTPKNYQSQDERVKQVYAVKIALDNSSGIFKAGMPVDVVIKTK
jgi:HlyD family secretion protein